MPSSVRLAVLARAARLDAGARAVLDAVAVVPGRAEHVARRGGEPAGRRRPRRLRHARHARRRGRRPRLPPRAGAARGGGRALRDGPRATSTAGSSACSQARPGVDPARIAHHAELAGDDRALARAASRACHLAADRTAYREAVRHGERALAVGLRPRPGRTGRAAGQAGPRAGRLRPRGGGRRAAPRRRRPLARDRRRPPRGRRPEPAGHRCWAAPARPVPATVAAERARILLEGHPPGRELALAYQRLTSLHMLARDRDQAAAWGERAIALARRLGETLHAGPGPDRQRDRRRDGRAGSTVWPGSARASSSAGSRISPASSRSA